LYYFFIAIRDTSKRIKMAQAQNFTPESKNNNWSDEKIEHNHPSFDQHQQPKQQDEKPQPPRIEDHFLDQAKTFYYRYKNVITGVNNRRDLQQLFEDTFHSWAPRDQQQPNFSKVLYALANGMKKVRVIDGGKSLLWRNERPEQQHHEHDARDRDFDDDRRRYFDVDHRRPDHHRPDHRHERPYYRDERSERPDHRRHDDRRQERHDDRRQERHDDRHERRHEETNLAEIVSNQQKMIDALMSKVM
jgi:hypothetical protein